MFEKRKLKRKIDKKKKTIAYIEKERMRSQAALVEAILTHQTPNDADVDYFNKYTDQINIVRTEMQELKHKLENM